MISIMYPILARYGAIFIYSYTIVMALGVLAAVGMLWRSSRHKMVSQWFDALLAVMVAALIGGRIGFVSWRWDYFQQHTLEIWQIWNGGLSYHAALLAGILGLTVFAALNNRSFFYYASFFAPALLLLSLFGWSACWLEGCAYGQETLMGWLSADLPDEYGVFAVRYQTQLLGFLLTSAAFLFILWYQRRQSGAGIFFMTLAALSLVHLTTSFMRGDPTITISSLRFDTLLNGLLLILALLLLQLTRHGRRSLENNR